MSSVNISAKNGSTLVEVQHNNKQYMYHPKAEDRGWLFLNNIPLDLGRGGFGAEKVLSWT